MNHLFLPDTQVKKDVPLDHLHAAGNLIVDQQPEVIVMIGDWADMPSLSTHDRAGSKAYENRRYQEDIAASKEAMEVLLAPIEKYNAHRKEVKRKQYRPRMVMTLGNHENRINRAIENNPAHLEGLISTDDLGYAEYGWEVHDFLQVVEIDGIAYSHYFLNPDGNSSYALGGTIQNKLSKLRMSFAHGHQQTFQYGIGHTAGGKSIRGLAAGAFYLHDEDYLGNQGNRNHWRGLCMLRNVVDGRYSLDEYEMCDLLKEYS